MAVPSLSVIRHGCLLHSLARADTPAPLQCNGDMVSGPGNAHMYTYRVNEIFAPFNFRRCARPMKIKQRENLTGEI